MTHMRYKRRFRLLFLSLSLSRLFLFRLSLFFFLFQIPLYVSRTGAHANSRIFPFLSLSSRHPRPAPRYSVLLTYARVHIYMCTHARSRDRRGTLSVSSSLSRARAAESLREYPCAFFGTEPSRLILFFLDFLLLLVEHAPLTEPCLVAAGKASSWHLNRSTRARRATLLRIRPKK